MEDLADLRSRERQAYAALSRLRDTADALPEDHPSVRLVVDAAALAEAHWHKLRDDADAMERAGSDASSRQR
jgi:hypothetical protein